MHDFPPAVASMAAPARPTSYVEVHRPDRQIVVGLWNTSFRRSRLGHGRQPNGIARSPSLATMTVWVRFARML
ncbi:hypothetical protein FRAHR75_150023 [Frankia sp. Hr75.2]|nr:hypothetical protein FRAHR75_150023 [Frankia sp. Hr75.2]